MDIINNSLSINIIGGGLTALVRYFLTLGGVNEYGGIPAWTAAGDFEIGFQYTPAVAFGRILGNVASFNNEIRPNSDLLGLNYKLGGGASKLILFDSAVTVGKLYTVVLIRVSGVVSVSLQGVIQADTSAEGNTASFDALGRTSTNHHAGVIANLSLTDTAGGDNRSYPIDDNTFGLGAVMRETIGGQDGTYFNVVEGDWSTTI